MSATFHRGERYQNCHFLQFTKPAPASSKLALALDTNDDMPALEGWEQTDGESAERAWSKLNPLTTSTREMGPNLRREIVDDHFDDWERNKAMRRGRLFCIRAKL
ncbi:hypothetical protein C8R46DRAFT_1227253 [Mycena filopes]|nr:hypothetical protein C8R46DRAFT_1227253 [Mycena filopes]